MTGRLYCYEKGASVFRSGRGVARLYTLAPLIPNRVIRYPFKVIYR